MLPGYEELNMRSMFRYLPMVLLCGVSFVSLQAQCPARPEAGTVVQDAPSLSSVKGVLSAEFTMQHSVDAAGYTHYCINYESSKGVVEAPTLRVNQGDQLLLDVKNRIESDGDSSGMRGMDVSASRFVAIPEP